MLCPACRQEVEWERFYVNGLVEGEIEVAFECSSPECGCVRYVYINQEQLERTTDKQEERVEDAWGTEECCVTPMPASSLIVPHLYKLLERYPNVQVYSDAFSTDLILKHVNGQAIVLKGAEIKEMMINDRYSELLADIEQRLQQLSREAGNVYSDEKLDPNEL